MRGSRLFRNRGGLRFEDATEKSGLPADLAGFGLAVLGLDLERPGLGDLLVGGGAGCSGEEDGGGACTGGQPSEGPGAHDGSFPRRRVGGPHSSC